MSEKNYYLIDSRDSEVLNDFLDRLESDSDLVSFDIETNSSNEKLARVIGIGVSTDINNGFYIPFAEFNKESSTLTPLLPIEDERAIVDELCKILNKKRLIMHNGVYDVCVMRHSYGVDLTPSLYADTILMKHTVAEERPFGLKDLAIMYARDIGIPSHEIANQDQLDLKQSVIANGGRWTKAQKDIYKGDLEIIAKYCCSDTSLTLRLFHYFSARLRKEGLGEFFYDREVMPLYKTVTIPMKLRGIFIDVEYFKKLEKELENGIIELTDKVFDEIRDDIDSFVKKTLDEKVKESRTGKYAEELLRYYNIPIPVNKRTGKPTLAKSALQPLTETFPDHPALAWLLYEPRKISVEVIENETVVIKQIPDPEDLGPAIPKKIKLAVKKKIFTDDNPDLPHVFNLSSNAHLSWLIFEHHGCSPKKYSRKTGAAQVDKDSLSEFSHLPFVKTLLQLKKEEKLLSTYVKPILQSHVDGWIYPGMLQFGTTSGRYSSAGDLNLQTLPRDDLRVKRGFIAPPGFKIVNSDFASLEPRIFSWVSGDEGLKQVWRDGLDLYSQIAIDIFGLTGISARESDDNYLKKVDPQRRQISKAIALAIPYGSSAWRISEMLKISVEEAQEIINKYLDAYPGLKTYMKNQDATAYRTGKVKTAFGRIRHLPDAKRLYIQFGEAIFNKRKMTNILQDEDFTSETYYRFRNAMNNAKNFPIQGTAAHLCNAAMIKVEHLFDENNIEGGVVLTVHDEITCIVREDQAEKAAELLQNAMEHNIITEVIDIPILAEPKIASNFAEAK